MTTTFKKQIESLSDVAKLFGLYGYHADVTIIGENHTAWVTIYFDKLSKKENIIRVLRYFKDDDDKIEFNSFENDTTNDKYYTFQMRKECKK